MTGYFEEVSQIPNRLHLEEDFRFSYNANSGGGQAFLAGRFLTPSGELKPLTELESKIANLRILWDQTDGNHRVLRLTDPRAKYEVRPRAAGSTSMKLGLRVDNTNSINLSKLVSSSLMLPPATTVNNPEDLDRSILTQKNYWLSSMFLSCEDYDRDASSVHLIARNLFFSGGMDKSGRGEARHFELNVQQRVADVIFLAEERALPDEVREHVKFFSNAYLDGVVPDVDDCERATRTIMRVLAQLYPARFTGLGDPLPFLMELATKQVVLEDASSSSGSDFSHNRIFFGAPGTGKSYQLEKEKVQLLGMNGGYERVTFYPDYSYSHFVGTYKPVPIVDSEGREMITYRYVPGPFMRVLVKALKSSQAPNPKPHLLLIEEINRANMSAVFGEVFQLLDRSPTGKSEYSIHPSEDIRRFLAAELGGGPLDYSHLEIPHNMFIWATMNSADQGVFPMDTAFKRRWDFSYIGVDTNESDLLGKSVILGREGAVHSVEWNSLRRAINDFLADHGVNEDKQMGPYFLNRQLVVPDGSQIEQSLFEDVFKHKVIMYLFEDAARRLRSSIFDGAAVNKNRYTDICAEFERVGAGIFHQQIIDASGLEYIEQGETLAEAENFADAPQ